MMTVGIQKPKALAAMMDSQEATLLPPPVFGR
jgi:hypothetical protein